MSAIHRNLQAVRRRIETTARAAVRVRSKIRSVANDRARLSQSLHDAAAGQRFVAEGAAIVRVGTAFFGERTYP